MSTPSKTVPQSGTKDWQDYGKYRSRVLHRESLADRVNLYIVEKPEGFTFRPGQATELAIDEPDWREKKRPFTFTSLPGNPRLEFIIKTYPTEDFTDHDGVTEHLGRDIEVGDRVLFGDAWGAIKYQGPGVFIAGGAGITPFVSILRQLEHENKLDRNRLFFSNRQAKDVFLQGELFRCLGNRVVCTLTDQQHSDYEFGRIDRGWLESRVKEFDQPFYLCGPPKMVEELKATLLELGVSEERIVHEDFS